MKQIVAQRNRFASVLAEEDYRSRYSSAAPPSAGFSLLLGGRKPSAGEAKRIIDARRKTAAKISGATHGDMDHHMSKSWSLLAKMRGEVSYLFSGMGVCV
jgi:hypothetical protein